MENFDLSMTNRERVLAELSASHKRENNVETTVSDTGDTTTVFTFKRGCGSIAVSLTEGEALSFLENLKNSLGSIDTVRYAMERNPFRQRSAEQMGTQCHVEYTRADSRMTCEACGQTYGQHMMDDVNTGINGEPFLHVLCDGSRVKL